MRHATAEYCEQAEARIRALEEELAACAARAENRDAAIELAAEDRLFFFRDAKSGIVYPALLVNDTFYYACADAEEVAWSNMPTILAEYRAHGWPAIVDRVASKRGVAPLPEVKDAIDKYAALEAALATTEAALAECQEDRLQRVRALEKVVETALAWLDADDEDAEITLVDVLLAYRTATQKEA